MDTTGVILIAGIGLVLGFLLAALIFTLRKDSSPREASSQQMGSGSKNSIHVWREAHDQQLVVEIDGVAYHQESELNARQRHVLASLIRELGSWGSPSTTPATEPAPPVPRTPSTEIREPDEAQKSTSLNPLKVFSDALQPVKKTATDDSEQSIVAQIDQILQTKLEGGQFEERGIRLVEGPDQGMVIEVGLDRYTEIESVPEEQIRQLIRLSVAEWEKSLGD